MQQPLKLFGLNGSRSFAQQVADHMDVELSTHVEHCFSDAEPYVRSDVNVRGCDVYVIQSLYSDHTEDVSRKLVKLLLFIGSLKDAAAHKVSVVAPYLAFTRQDRKTESRAPITTKYIAMLLETAGADRLLTMDVHSLAALQNAYRIPTDNLEAKNLLADYLASHLPSTDHLTVLSPDSGGMGRAKRFRNALAKRLGSEVGLAYLDKTRTSSTSVEGHAIIGEVKNRKLIAIDDLISSGSTLLECAKATALAGGQLIATCASHGLFVGKVNENLKTIERIIVCDTIQPCHLEAEIVKKVDVIPTARLFGQAIRRTHDLGGSISDLLK